MSAFETHYTVQEIAEVSRSGCIPDWGGLLKVTDIKLCPESVTVISVLIDAPGRCFRFRDGTLQIPHLLRKDRFSQGLCI